MYTSEILRHITILNSITPGEMAIIGSAMLAQTLKEMGIPSPGVTQSALMYAGYQGIAGNYLPGMVIVLAIYCGSMCGATITYHLGKYLGIPLIKKFGKYIHLTQDKLETVKNKVNNKSVLVIFGARFIPTIMAPLSFTAGMIRIPLLKYLAGISLVVILWASLFIGIGAVSGRVLDNIHIPGIEGIIPALLCTIVAAFLIRLGVIYFLTNRKKKPSLN